MRVVIELKRDANPHVVLNQLYKHTPLRTTSSVNMRGSLVDGSRPRDARPCSTCSGYFLEHRRDRRHAAAPSSS